jgi:hypothetical protein
MRPSSEIYPIDLLACVPPKLVLHDVNGTSSIPARTLIAAGKKVWDASSIDVREHFPADRDALRIVQYDSCRGLEGWTVMNYAFDDFWEYKYNEYFHSSKLLNEPVGSRTECACEFASRWAMIPLTRAMDTLVINVSNRPSLVRDALAKVHARRGDFVQWIDLDAAQNQNSQWIESV